MKKAFSFLLLGMGVGVVASAAVVSSPEIDPASGSSALALLSGAILVLRGRRGK